ncbi:UDP-4-amino-4-deoxy-L-arabinose formyltransferase / UDP-glucuronic acid dehydrogenase (UDP-4-keto-hexauronic acid decarboxylating) [Meinhardsimonia xiamenensis]|jgi:methionyl-tRNA formyltransferase|uniref:UDP-4-amino-4-deoxy-L-arabinose formyltransferase / UDP-glucuronic acid dehydrogenase (UDP-4-keto-hexauronic acid decarboxylating) n=1 Tax=Meinhardsimonia xiamenensis TaxID=990712 RepID=A0A1G9HET6_9RHOB|nr:methionyl-tRNA formyltransferase [Meinhardsimonia xiamenensis]PRX28364.1 UDP-4-amino-4-deoxy-L-arabinose formyltransferase/UDP-glucuronic acid dehydrogenase (UDP-4-keto-hexauronic acid decarboxylating) [Meinhardsimonia xiamenensis]SDL11365.1 UDP-4-amino-4-deoxy-L-arabinose formyltransferase / UDP-glucuronic acid dehydrogenase (UDP-4-keto-hexauronic acid decarboxylating) [Meinhardsimonia xiamenensis]
MTQTLPALRIGWLSHHVEGIRPLKAILAAGFPVHAIITLEDELRARRSGAADYAGIAAAHGIPLHHVRNVNDPEAVALLKGLELDILFVIGWSQILHPPALRSARLGCLGAHASLLPANRGSAPVNWALIKGENLTGNTLMRLAEGVDAGDILAQRPIPITPFDNVATIYDRVAETNCEMILELLRDLSAGKPLQARPQTDVGAPLLPRRRPEHGLIDWATPARQVYDFIRALTRPYPGAFSAADGVRMTVWRSALLPLSGSLAAPGTVLGPLISDTPEACGLIVACAEGAVAVLELEEDGSKTLSGPALAQSGITSFADPGESRRQNQR